MGAAAAMKLDSWWKPVISWIVDREWSGVRPPMSGGREIERVDRVPDLISQQGERAPNPRGPYWIVSFQEPNGGTRAVGVRPPSPHLCAALDAAVELTGGGMNGYDMRHRLVRW